MTRRLTVVGAFALALVVSFQASANPSCAAVFSGFVQTGPTLELFTADGGFAPGYRDLVDGLQPGSRIRLPNGVEYEVHKILGGGQLSKVIDIGDGWALRIAAGDGTRKNNREIEASRGQFLSGMNSFMRVHDEVKATGVRVVEVDKSRTFLPYAIVVKKETFLFEGDRFFHALRFPEHSKLAPEIVAQAREDFIKFIAQTYMFDSIGDFGTRQIGYNGKEWVLFDMGDVSMSDFQRPIANFESKDYLLRTLKYEDEGDQVVRRQMPKDLEKEVSKRIFKLREHASKNGTWYERNGDYWIQLIHAAQPHPIPVGEAVSMRANWYEMKGAMGVLPPGKVLKFRIQKFEGEKKGIATYSVVVENDGRPLQATLHVAIGIKDVKRIAKLRKKVIEQGSPFYSKSDAILVYNEADRDQLMNIQELQKIRAF